MQLAWLTPLNGAQGPFATVYLTNQEGPGADKAARWQILRRALQDQGAPPEVIELLDESVHHARVRSGPGQIIIASSQGVHIDRFVATAPVSDEAAWDEVPHLGPAIRAAQDDVRFALVTVDRTGADLAWFDPEELDGAGGHTEQIASGHDVVNKTSLRGRSFAKVTARAEDSWERNADLIVAELDKFLRHHDAELVVLAGDIRTRALVQARLNLPRGVSLAEIHGGARGGGVNRSAMGAEIATVLDEHKAARLRDVTERFSTESAAPDATSGLDEVVHALGRGQVAELVITAQRLVALGDARVVVGDHPLDVTMVDTPEGAGDSTRADAALIRAALHQDARLSVIEDPDLSLADGIGAIMRWVNRDSAEPAA